MPLLAQIADAFDKSTWTIIFCVGFGTPLLGCALSMLRWSAQTKRRWQLIAVYYALSLGCFIGLTFLETLWVAVPFYLLLLAGPILGCVLLFV